MRMRKLVGTGCTLALAVLIAAGCSGSVGGGIPKNAICTVDGDPIAKSDFNRIISQARKNYESQEQDFPKKSSPEYKQLQNQGVDYLIEQQLFAQQAEKLGVKVTDKAVNKRLKQLKKSFFKGNEKQYKAELKKQGLTEKEVKDNIRQQLLSEKLFEKVTKKIKVTDKKAKAYYEDNPGQYKQPESRDVAHILVKKKADADAIYAQVKGGDAKKFAALAKKKSEDTSSAVNGGELNISRGQTVPEFDKAAFALKKGAVSKPIKTQYGFHVILAKGDVKEARQQPFKEVRTQIKQTLLQEERSKRMQDWRDDIRKDAEEQVKCKKGFVWTQTVTETEEASPTPPAEESEAGKDSEGDKDAKADKDAKDSKDAKAADTKKDADAKSDAKKDSKDK